MCMEFLCWFVNTNEMNVQSVQFLFLAFHYVGDSWFGKQNGQGWANGECDEKQRGFVELVFHWHVSQEWSWLSSQILDQEFRKVKGSD